MSCDSKSMRSGDTDRGEGEGACAGGAELQLVVAGGRCLTRAAPSER